MSVANNSTQNISLGADDTQGNLNKNINDESSFNWSSQTIDDFVVSDASDVNNLAPINKNITVPVVAKHSANVKQNITEIIDTRAHNLEETIEFDASIEQKEINLLEPTTSISTFSTEINNIITTSDTSSDNSTIKDTINKDVSAVDVNMNDDTVSLEMADVPEHLAENLYFKYPLLEVGRRLWPSTIEAQHYTKGCIFSPDGTCILVPVHMDGMHIIEVPTDLYNMNNLNTKRKLSNLETAVHIKEGGTVYDVAWYPFMNSQSPETCCWLATRQHEPIHMWDAFTGELRCSYRGYDEVDEVESAITVRFSNDGEKIIAGYKKNIKLFDTNIPGRDFVKFNVKQAVSCIALAQDNDYHCITTGSWTGYVQHYDLRMQNHGPLFTLGGHTGGITWLRYIQNNGNKMLFSGARKDEQILQWDMRNFKVPFNIYKREIKTNQRIYFDISQEEQWLISGDTSGVLHAWNLKETYECKTQLHNDCCNCVNFHNTIPILATSSGQFHFTNFDNEVAQITPTEENVTYENALLLLWYGQNNKVK